MKIIKPVAVKQILTEASKQAMLDKFESQKFQLQKECEQLRFEMRRHERERKFEKGTLRQKFEEEIKRRQEKNKLLEYQVEQLEILPIGSELNDGEVQTMLEVEIGDDWEQASAESAIIIKDGKVFEIR
ncbi:MAG TPA: YlqD family protein [Bacillales bacterium]|nr:YlqD family protein [Bacillales bacterium]